MNTTITAKDAEEPNEHAMRRRAAAERLHAVELRATSQRIAILAAFQVEEHLTADEILERLKVGATDLDRATIYRTLERFRTVGLISETDMGDGALRFEMMHAQPHHHLVCSVCRKTFELDDDLVEPLREQIWQRYGFGIRIDHLALFGTCSACLG